MGLQNFIPRSLPAITAAWLNQIDKFVNGVQSLLFGGSISGATPTLTNSLHTVSNPAPTNMTTMLLPAGQTNGYVVLYFVNGNTTLKAASIGLKGGVDVTPVAGNAMSFFKEASISSSWVEISRNF